MKKVTLVLISMFLLVTNIDASVLDSKISINRDNISFSELCNIIQSETNINIYYLEDDVADLNISINAADTTIQYILEYALVLTEFAPFEWEESILILPKDIIITELPIYSQEAKEALLAQEAERLYKTGRQANAKKVIRIGKRSIISPNELVKITGSIQLENNDPAIGATVYVEEVEIGAAANTRGDLVLYLKPGKYNINVECLGYKNEKCFLNVYSSGSFKIQLKKENIEIDEVVVYGNRQTNITSKDPGLEKLSPKAIKKIPMMMGERDLLKISEMLPGIVSVGEGSAGLNVRGGNADQNAFYINNIPIYNTSHLFGFFPIFNSDIIKDFTIYKGHIPAKYGGRLSSIFNIETRTGNQSEYGFKGGINPISANLTLEGPIIKDKLSVLLNGRTTYSDWILSRIDDPTISESEASFDDFSISVDYKSKKTHTNIFIYSSKDHFKLSDINTYQYRNNGIALNYQHTFSENFFGRFSLIGSNYDYSTIDTQEPVQAYEHKYKIEHYEAKLDFNHTIFPRNTLNYGLNIVNYRLDRGSINPYGAESFRSTNDLGKESAYKGSLYLSDMYDISHWLSITLGARYSIFAPTGPKDINMYNENYPRDVLYINDTLQYNNGDIIKQYNSLDFRFATTISTDRNGSIKLSYNQMHQNLFMLNNTVTVAPNTQWKLADYYIEPAQSNQISVGVFRDIPRGNWETSVEVFYKTTTNYLEFKDGADFLNSPAIETEVLQGDQESYGIEFLLKRSNKKIDGWLSYTYSRSFITVDGENEWEKINGGVTYPSNYDIPHVVNTVLNVHFNKRLTVSSVFNYQSGRPITYPTSIYYLNGNPCIEYSKRNEYRIPDYMRLDLSLTLEGNLKKNKLVHSSWMFSIYNVTGRNNPYSVFFKSEEGRIRSYKYSVIGVPFFTITWIFKRGNYNAD